MLIINLKEPFSIKYCFKKIVPNEQTKDDNGKNLHMIMPRHDIDVESNIFSYHCSFSRSFILD